MVGSRKNKEESIKGFNVARVVNMASLKWGDRSVLYHYENNKNVSYKEVDYFSNRVGNMLKDTGVEVENRVAILMNDCPEWVYTFFGVLKIGAVPVPLNTLLGMKDQAFYLTDSRAKVLFVEESLFRDLSPIIASLPYLKKVVVCNGSGVQENSGRIIDWNSFIQDADGTLDVEQTHREDIALFAYSSGSTGKPRAIMHTHGNVDKGASFFRKICGVEEGHIQYHIPKLYFLTGLCGLVNAFRNGSSMILLSDRPRASTVLDLIAKYQPTFLGGPPTILARMVDAAKKAPHLSELKSIQYIFCAGETLTPNLFHRFKETFNKVIYNCWGAQELISAPLSWPNGAEVPFEKIGSVGTPCMDFEVKIVDSYGNEVLNDVPGEIMVKGESHFVSYWHQYEKASRKIFNGWYKPGDFFMRDQDGYYWYLGRSDDMVKIGGRQVFPVEVEHEVARHPAVLETAVIPTMNSDGLTEIHTFVVLRAEYEQSSALASQIQDSVKRNLAPYKKPHKVVFVDDVPKTATGKIQRFRLKQTDQKTPR